jgi:glycosyltransferase involved in cell wall biosynthesis
VRVVLVTNGLRYGGAERIVEALAIGLAARGDDVSVIATTRDGPVGDALRARKIPVTILGIKSAYDARVPVALARAARRFGAEIIHSHLAVSDIATAAANLFAPNARIVSTVHSPYLGISRRVRALWRLALRRFDRVIAVSEPVRALLPRSTEAVIVYPSLFEEDGAKLTRVEARRRLGLPSDAKIAIAIGRLVRVKAFDVLAEAARMLKTAGARVIVIGEGPELEALELAGTLQLAGSRDDASEVLAAADVLVSASRSEGFPQTPLHAMALALPVVATDVGGTSEIVVDEKTGLLVRPEDPRALALGIDRIFADPDLGKRLGEAGRARLFERGFTKKAMIENTREIYAALLGE